MRILFVGEGPTDVGSPQFAAPPRAATGVLFILAKKLCPSIGQDCLAMFWREIPVGAREKKKNIYAARVAAAMALAQRHQCEGVVIVVDRESKDEDRLKDMELGVRRGREATAFTGPTVCGEAILSIEAWVLGSPSALAAALKINTDVVLEEYKPYDVEEFNPRSGKPEKNSKKLVEKIAAKGHREDDTPFREEVAEHSDLEEMKRHCKNGFRPFAENFLAAFGPRST